MLCLPGGGGCGAQTEVAPRASCLSENFRCDAVVPCTKSDAVTVTWKKRVPKLRRLRRASSLSLESALRLAQHSNCKNCLLSTVGILISYFLTLNHCKSMQWQFMQLQFWAASCILLLLRGTCQLYFSAICDFSTIVHSKYMAIATHKTCKMSKQLVNNQE